MKKTSIKVIVTLFSFILSVIAPAEASASAEWAVNPADYRYDMSLYFNVFSAASGNAINYDLYETAAFAGDECRGVAEILALPDGNRCLYMRIRSNSENGENITFKVRNKTTQEIKEIPGETMPFESNKMTGYPSEPYAMQITVEKYTLTVYLDNEVYMTDELEFGEPVVIPEPEVPEGYKFDGWIEEIPETMPPYDLEIHGSTSDCSSVASILADDTRRVDIYTPAGLLLYKNVVFKDIRSKLAAGIYIIDGEKFLIE